MRKSVFAGIGMAVVLHSLFMVAPVGAAEKDIVLPRPGAGFNVDLMKAFQERRSSREFVKKDIRIEDIAAILWAGYGINRPDGKRTVPSAHGDDFIDLYALMPGGNYYYDPKGHRLVFVSGENIIGKVARQEFVNNAAMVVVIVGKQKGPHTGDYINFTAGCAAQNMYLAAGALNLGTVVMGWIHADVLKNGLNLKDFQFPLYIMPVGAVK